MVWAEASISARWLGLVKSFDIQWKHEEGKIVLEYNGLDAVKNSKKSKIAAIPF